MTVSATPGKPAPKAGEFRLSDAEFAAFCRLVEEHSGIQLKTSKRGPIEARLGERLRGLGLAGIRPYWRLLGEPAAGPGELRWLLNRVTTNKTSFFREPHHFDYLEEAVLRPRLDEARRSGRPAQFRFWSAGCSTGQEPYSLSIRILSVLGGGGQLDARILATDLDTDALASAGAGVYADPPAEELPAPVKRRYFLKGVGAQAGRIRVRDEVRRLVEFRSLNLCQPVWPRLPVFDAILCRNALIYFNSARQEQVVRRLVRQLRPGGLIIVGHSENLFRLKDCLTPLRNTIYQLREDYVA